MASLPITIYQLPASQINLIPITDGNILFETDQGNDGKIYLDKDGNRIQIGGNYLPTYEVEFLASGWSATAPYTQTINVTSVTDDYISIPTLNQTDATNQSNQRQLQLNFSYITSYTSNNGSITATAKFTKPTTNLKVKFVGQ